MTEISWPTIADRLRNPKNYWLATVSADGAPHSVPVWGVVVDDNYYLYSERDTVKARNLARNNRVVVHLESGADVVIVHGRALEVTGAELDAVRQAFAVKYSDPDEIEWVPTADPQFIVWRLNPARAMTWQLDDMEGSQRRWEG